MPTRSVSRWTMIGLALTLPALLGGCRWLPTQRPDASLDPRQVSMGPAGLESAPPLPSASLTAQTEPRVPLPKLPLRAISDVEALADHPPAATPLLDDALVRAGTIEAITVSDFQEPEKPPFSPPQSQSPKLSKTEVVEPPDPAPTTSERLEGEDQPPINAPERSESEPAMEPTEPGPEKDQADLSLEASWRSDLEALRKLARDQAQAGNDPSGIWSARDQVLTRLAEVADTSRFDPDQILWQTAASILARADAEAEAKVESEKESNPSETNEPAPEAPKEPELAVVGLSLCERVEGFGLFEPIDPEAIRAGQAVMLYWEVEGLQAESDGTFFRTRLASSLAIFSADADEQKGEPLWSRSLGQADDLCRRRRRDYFVNSRLTLPDSLEPGSYQLRLTLEDRNSGQTASQSIPLTIQP